MIARAHDFLEGDEEHAAARGYADTRLSALLTSQAKMIQANFAVGPGWWNQWIASWHTLFGGNITSFDDVLMLARQEVLQSLRDKASEDGFDEVVNVRLESARLTYLAKKSNKYIEIFAYGTAIKYA